MAAVTAKDRLVDFLDRRVFDPILTTPQSSYSHDEEREKLERVQRQAALDKRRYHDDYLSADEVMSHYLEDLHSPTTQEMCLELAELKLPSLSDVRQDLRMLYERLESGPSAKLE